MKKEQKQAFLSEGKIDPIQKRAKKPPPLQRKIIAYMASVAIPSRQAVADNLGVSLATVRRVIRRLKDNGDIARIGNNRSGHYILKQHNKDLSKAGEGVKQNGKCK